MPDSATPPAPDGLRVKLSAGWLFMIFLGMAVNATGSYLNNREQNRRHQETLARQQAIVDQQLRIVERQQEILDRLDVIKPRPR